MGEGEGEGKRQVWSLRAEGTGEQGEVEEKADLERPRKGRFYHCKAL